MRGRRPHETDARIGGHSRAVARRHGDGAGSDHADAGAAAGQSGTAADTRLRAVADPDAALAVASAVRTRCRARLAAGNNGADRSAEDAILPQRSLEPAARARPRRGQPRLAAVSGYPATAAAARPLDFPGSLPVVPAKAGTHLSEAREAEGWIPAFAGMTG